MCERERLQKDREIKNKLKKVKDKDNLISLICGLLKKRTQMNLFANRSILTDIENKLTATKGERLGEEG